MAEEKGRQSAPRNALERMWPELRDRVGERWSRLNDEWLGEVDGRRDRLAERLRDAYGIDEAEANRQVADFVETHWAALSAGKLTSTSISTSDSAGARGDTITNTPAAAPGGGATPGSNAGPLGSSRQ